MPEEFSAVYEAQGAANWVTNRFYEEGPTKTRWVMQNEFKFSTWVLPLATFIRGAFRKQTMEDMARFREFAESA